MNLVTEALGWLGGSAQWSGAASIPVRLAEHTAITLGAVLIAAVIGLPLGVAVGHTRSGATWVGALVGAVRAIPTLGLLTLIGLVVGIGLVAPMLALVVLGLPSVLAGAYAGIQSVDPAVVDAARAQGMTLGQVVRTVELPLASPVILGGLRTAALQIVATATLAAYMSDYGLGRYLFAGLKTRDYPQMLGGAMLVTGLALVLEIGMAGAQRWAARRLVHHPSS